jgi:FtsP/CotA-like multicopper oxidase with cupredoxin domain
LPSVRFTLSLRHTLDVVINRERRHHDEPVKVGEMQVWDVVINVPPKATARIAWYSDDRPGMSMYHCHILEHHAAGLMAHFEVVRRIRQGGWS